MSPKKRVLIGSPIRQTPEILTPFLTSLAELERNNLIVNYLFVDDNEAKASQQLLLDFQANYGRTVIHNEEKHAAAYEKDEFTHYWPEDTIWKVAKMKDAILSYALEKKFDYVFLIDSDLILHPHTLEQLVSANKAIVANIFWTKWQPDTMEMPQVWLSDQYTLYHKSRQESLSDEESARRTWQFFAQLRIPGIYEVGGLGACTLISRKAIQAGVRFAEIPNLSFWGEDRHFCIRARAMGFSLYVDTHYPAYHIYRKSELAGVDAYKQGSNGVNADERKITISLCLIVKNEENALPICLHSVRGIANEIIIVDTGSTDRTKEVAARYTDRIYDFEWVDDFAAARNFAFSQATQQYILWLDADDTLTEKDRLLFLELIRTLEPVVDRVTMNYNLSFDENQNVTYSLRRNRLVRRDCQFQWIGAVHEYLAASGSVIHSEIAVTHRKDKLHTDRNLQIYRKKLAGGETLSLRDQFYYANECREHGYYEEAVNYYEDFLQSPDGWLEDKIAASLHLATCYSHLGKRDEQLMALFRAFEFDTPRADCCCRIGSIFLGEQDYLQAIYWYEIATQFTKPKESMGFMDHSSWTWLPHVQLCLCYDRIGKVDKAKFHHDISYSYNPTHPSVIHNQKYFEQIGIN
ncbi:glycosyltransferase [Paenibacillus sp. MAH-36]|uniref:Glycosyltransferase family 2 protein n=1 Tax=Paenibacillus violae TaxID=3077234 RepID=A0ABU3R7R2_9BACL|nr:glycosyltransferase family 2 protein [Paenibacillus sp. PFR10]MDU0200306.1 glycosyltransferase family 2 protein [Paenibacillus sp. PFR10]